MSNIASLSEAENKQYLPYPKLLPSPSSIGALTHQMTYGIRLCQKAIFPAKKGASQTAPLLPVPGTVKKKKTKKKNPCGKKY